jgi:hypothetical protein
MFRIRKMLAAAIALIALSVVGTAQAYDSSTCNGLFGGANVSRTDRIKINYGHADFGDDLHVFGGPGGDAVICWSIDGRVAVRGKLFSDPGLWPHNEEQYATARIRFVRSDGTLAFTPNPGTALSNGLQSTDVQRVSPFGNFIQVRIQLSYTNEYGAETFYRVHGYNR